MVSPLRYAVVGGLMALLPFVASLAHAGIEEQLKLAREAGDANAEIELLRRWVDSHPDDAAAREKLIRLWLGSGDFAMAEADLAKWPDAPPRLRAIVEARVLAERDGKWRDAISVLETFSKSQPGDPEVLELLARDLLHEKQWSEAIAALTTLINGHRAVWQYLARADAKKQSGDYAGAVQDAQRALAMAPNSGWVKEGVPPYQRLGKVLPLIEPANRALAANPKQPEWLLKRGAAYFYGDVPAAALLDAEAAMALLPDSREARILRARSVVALGREPAEEVAAATGVNLSAPLQNPEGAAALITADLRVAAQPSDAGALVARAQTLNRDQQFALAEEDALAALALDGKNGPALLEALRAASAAGRTEDAAVYFRRLEQTPVSNDVKAIALALLVETNFRQANYTQTLALATRALELKETEAMLRYQLQALQRLGRDEEAEAVQQRLERFKGGGGKS